MIDIDQILQKSGTIVSGHLVYKAGTHGIYYIDKERYVNLSARELSSLIRGVGLNAIAKGLQIPANVERVGVIGPAMGAIAYTLTLAECLEESFPAIKFFPARSELETDPTGKKIHVIPDKLLFLYQDNFFFILEDIVNNGTTVREVKKLFEKVAGARIIAAMCIVDRGGQTPESLGIKQYYPLRRIQIEQWDPHKEPCPLCTRCIPINTTFGRGKRWVELFGHPPYPPETDFSPFWE